MRRALSPEYACAELLWYLSRSDTIEGLKPYAPQYEKFVEPDGRAYGAYGHRIKHNAGEHDQLDVLQRLLGDMPNTRQAVVSMWRPDDIIAAWKGGKKDLPCTLCWMFFLRDNALHMHTVMRSNDLWLGFPYDTFVFTTVQRLVADTMDCNVGTYTHTVGSLHLYDKDLVKARRALQPENKRETIAHDWPFDDGLRNTPAAVSIETDMRSGRITTKHDFIKVATQLGVAPATPLGDALNVLTGRWLDEAIAPHSKALTRGMLTHANHRGS